MRWSVQWSQSALGLALTKALLGEAVAVPRVGNLYPGTSTPIPTGHEPRTIAELCHNRAVELVMQYRTLYVLWSGGVDSTLVAACLLAHKLTSTRIILSTCEQTDRDAPVGVRERLAELGAEFEPINPERMREVVAQGGMVVNGCHADSILLGELTDQAGLWGEILDMTPADMLQANLKCGTSEALALLRELEPVISLMPFERTGANVAFWLDFTCLWDRDELDMMLRFDLQPPGVGYVSFFNTEYFQLWAMQDARFKVQVGWAGHKHLYRDILTEILGQDFPYVKNDFDCGLERVYRMPASGVIGMNDAYQLLTL